MQTTSEVLPTQLPQSFYDAIDAKDVDRAFKLWTQEFERILFQIADVSQTQPLSIEEQLSVVKFVFMNNAHIPKSYDSKQAHYKQGKFGKRTVDSKRS